MKTKDLNDFKFFCFDGKMKFFKIDFCRTTCHQANYYGNECNLLNFGEMACPPNYSKHMAMPTNIKQMIEIAEKLSQGFTFMRVDLYNVDGRIFFGETTFFPASGFGMFTNTEWDRTIGDYLKLPQQCK